MIAKRLDYISDAELVEALDLAALVGKLVNGLIRAKR